MLQYYRNDDLSIRNTRIFNRILRFFTDMANLFTYHRARTWPLIVRLRAYEVYGYVMNGSAYHGRKIRLWRQDASILQACRFLFPKHTYSHHFLRFSLRGRPID